MAIGYINEAKNLAESKRKTLGLDDGPIKNIFGILDDEGVFVVKMPIGSKELSGAFYYDKEKGNSKILINSNRSAGHQNFTAAHEFCHHLIDKEEQPILIDFNDGNKPIHEKRADCFAANFLMPEVGIRNYIGDILGNSTKRLSDEELVRIRNEFDVSWQSLIYRLNNLGYLFDAIFNEKLKKISKLNALSLQLGFESQQAFEQSELKLPSKYLQLAFRAYFAEKITLNKLAEFLHMSFEKTKDAVAEIRRVEDEVHRE